MLKKEKAVTLIALIITIIILLILAGVAFNSLLGSNGLLNRAGDAGEVSKRAAENEENVLEHYTEGIDNWLNKIGGSGEDTLANPLVLFDGSAGGDNFAVTGGWEHDGTIWNVSSTEITGYHSSGSGSAPSNYLRTVRDDIPYDKFNKIVIEGELSTSTTGSGTSVLMISLSSAPSVSKSLQNEHYLSGITVGWESAQPSRLDIYFTGRDSVWNNDRGRENN